jgi:lactocepin
MGNVATERSFSYELPVTNNSYVEIKVVDLFGNTTIKTINIVDDHKKDLIAVTGVQNGKAYNTNVTPVISIKEVGTTSKITLNGNTYSGATITKEGSYTLKVSAVSKAGYSREVVINFTIDKTAPIITVKNVVKGGKYTKVTPVISYSKDTVQRTIMLDGKTYNNKAITSLGYHVLKITAVDKAGNQTVKWIGFNIIK